MTIRFDGRVAIVTGAGNGLGRAHALGLAARGARVVVNDFGGARDGTGGSLTAAETVVEEIRKAGGEAIADGADVSDFEQVTAMVAKATETWGSVDIIVNNAGYTWDGVVHRMTDEQFQAMLDIHTIVPFRMTRAIAPHWREAAKAEAAEGKEVFRKIVNISSVSGTMGNAGQANYAAAKAGVTGLTKTIAKEWGQFKINCNAIAFGFVETRLTASNAEGGAIEREGEEIKIGIPEQAREMAKFIIPLGRPAQGFDGRALVAQCDTDLLEGVVGLQGIDRLLACGSDFSSRDLKLDLTSHQHGGHDVARGIW